VNRGVDWLIAFCFGLATFISVRNDEWKAAVVTGVCFGFVLGIQFARTIR
jgi:hypothetical protein